MATFRLNLSFSKNREWQYKQIKPDSSMGSHNHFSSLNDLYDYFVKTTELPPDEVHVEINYHYRSRKINIYHNWRHELIVHAQTHNNIKQSLNGDYSNIEKAYQAAKAWIDEDLKLSKPRLIAKIKKLPSKAFTIFVYLIGMIPFISCAVSVYWLYHRADRDESLKTHPKLTSAIYISAFITLMGVLYVGIKKLLFFIPWGWGAYDEDGDWRSMRESIAIMLAFLSSGFISTLFSKYETLKDKIDYLEEKTK